MKKKSKTEREAFVARVEENNRRLLELAKKAQAELDSRKQAPS
jgi:hypothetical protein